MDILDFKNFALLQDSGSMFQPNKKTLNGETFLISKVVHMKFLKENTGIIFFRRTFHEDIFDKVDFNKQNKRISRRLNNGLNGTNRIELVPIRNIPRPISTKKYNDLIKLLKWVPKQFHPYFQNLSHTVLKEDQ